MKQLHQQIPRKRRNLEKLSYWICNKIIKNDPRNTVHWYVNKLNHKWCFLFTKSSFLILMWERALAKRWLSWESGPESMVNRRDSSQSERNPQRITPESFPFLLIAVAYWPRIPPLALFLPCGNKKQPCVTGFEQQRKRQWSYRRRLWHHLPWISWQRIHPTYVTRSTNFRNVFTWSVGTGLKTKTTQYS